MIVFSKKWSFILLTILILLSLFLVPRAARWNSHRLPPPAPPEALSQWEDMRFGMNIIWGPVTLTGEEISWSRAGVRPGVAGSHSDCPPGPTPIEVYDNLYREWNPTQFDAREWVRIAQEAGMKYITFPARHHDGFCLYDSQLSDYKSTSPESPWRHDPLADIAEACREKGLKLIVYYSQPDWHHPDYRTVNHPRYIKYLHGQIRELLTRYGRVDGIWFDGVDGVYKPDLWDARRLFIMARALQPWLVINNRCGFPGDYDTPEQYIGAFQINRPWESLISLGDQWAWKPEDNLKSTDECIRILVKCAGRGGNLALNTGPMPDGRIEPRQADRLREIGQWLAQYGESIYGTRGGPFRPAFWGTTTNKANTLYVHVLTWRGNTVALPPVNAKVLKSTLLTGGVAEVTQTGSNVTVSVAPEYRKIPDTVIALELDQPPSAMNDDTLPSGSVALGKTATGSESYQPDDNKNGFGPDKTLDDNHETRWACNPATQSAWLEVDLGQPTTVDSACIDEIYNRTRKFQLQALRGDNKWETIHQGETIGDDHLIDFPPTTAQRFRLNITEAIDGPSIKEFHLFAAPSH